MKHILTLLLSLFVLAACKNNGSGSASANAKQKQEKPAVTAKDIIVGAKRKPTQPDFQVVDLSVNENLLQVVFQYSGGCEEHDFEAHFNGGWLKTMPPKAVLDFEHLNPNNDACRSIVKDTILFNLDAVKYSGSNEVVVVTTANKKLTATYKY